jgi:hypothetical protein
MYPRPPLPPSKSSLYTETGSTTTQFALTQKGEITTGGNKIVVSRDGSHKSSTQTDRNSCSRVPCDTTAACCSIDTLVSVLASCQMQEFI